MVLDIAPSGMKLTHWSVVLVTLVITGLLGLCVNYMLEKEVRLSAESSRPYLIAIGLVATALIGLVIRHARSAIRVSIDGSCLEVSSTRLIRKLILRLDPGTVRDVVFGGSAKAGQQPLFGSRWVVVVADRDRLAFGETLTADEAHFVSDVIRAAVSRSEWTVRTECGDDAANRPAAPGPVAGSGVRGASTTGSSAIVREPTG